MVPSIQTSPLSRADGSATYTTNLFSILGAVNGPVEVQRRDELPEEAAIEVNVRPASGVGGPRERWLEGVLHAVIRSILLVHLHPRTLVQITLQVVKEPGIRLGKGKGDIAILPALVNTIFLALVDGGIPLDTTMTAVMAVVDGNGAVEVEPDTEKALLCCSSIHALAFDGRGELLLDESTGGFRVETWQKVVDASRKLCYEAIAATGEDEVMRGGDVEGTPWLRSTLEEKVKEANAWRETT